MDGKNCNPYFFRASWNNDMIPEAMGKLMKEEGIKDVFELSANYQAGKDMLAGFNRRLCLADNQGQDPLQARQ